MSTAVTFINPTRIIKQEGGNYFRFLIMTPKGAKRGYFNHEDVGDKSTLHPQLQAVAHELNGMMAVERFYINIGGDQPDRIVVKFSSNITVDDPVLDTIKQIIGNELG